MRRLRRTGGPFPVGFTPGEVTASGPYDPGFAGVTVLTQVHCHTNQSDGSFSPSAVVADYVGRGYGALVLTDHDKVTVQPAGIDTPISGSEYTSSSGHIIGMDTTYVRGSEADAQDIIAAVLADGGQVEMAHPKWTADWTLSELEALTDYIGIEIHNGKCIGGTGANPVTFPGFAVDRWDQILATRRDVWGFAVDDLHNITAFLTYDTGRIQVFADTDALADVMAALVAGNFVADVGNFGVTPGYPDRTDDDVSLTCTGATKIEVWGSTGGPIDAATGDTITHVYSGLDNYVRLVVWGDYTEDFSGSAPWYATAYDGSWTWGSGQLTLAGNATARHYIIRRHREGDFQAQVEIELASGGNDAALLMFNLLNQTYWYAIRIGKSGNLSFNNKLAAGYTTDAGANLNLITSANFIAAAGTPYTVKMDYTAATGLIRAKVWETATAEPDWMIEAADTHWRHGMFGFRANWTPTFRDFYVNGFKTYYQPIALDPA